MPDRPLSPKAAKSKIALFCNVDDDAVITAKDVEIIYEVPLVLHKEGIDEKLAQVLNMWTGRPDLRPWEELVQTLRDAEAEVTIAMVGKYVELTESYKSLNESLVHGGIPLKVRVNIDYYDSEKLEDPSVLAGAAGILVRHGRRQWARSQRRRSAWISPRQAAAAAASI